MNLQSPYQSIIATPFGGLGIHCEDGALTGIIFLTTKVKSQHPRDNFAKIVVEQMQAYLDNADFKFDLPVKLSGTEHQLKVWQAMREIPRGQVQTYGALAQQFHASPRAVGQACGNNPIPVVIPCHRVVSKTGLGGFMHSSDNSILGIKRWLLNHEQH